MHCTYDHSSTSCSCFVLVHVVVHTCRVPLLGDLASYREVTRLKLKSGAMSNIKARLWFYSPHQRIVGSLEWCCVTVPLYSASAYTFSLPKGYIIMYIVYVYGLPYAVRFCFNWLVLLVLFFRYGELLKTVLCFYWKMKKAIEV